MSRIVKQVNYPVINRSPFLRVCAYARVSSGKDAMLNSLSAQVSYYSSYVQKHNGWEYVGVYIDEALTGTKDNRAEFQRMILDCKQGKIDMIITKSISRFARNTVTLLETVRELKSIGVDVYFEEQNIHSMSGDGELLLTILASYAQEESLSVSQNCKWRIRKGFENGELTNLRFMYGYEISKGKIEINEAEAEIIRYVFSAFIDGDTLGNIANKLKGKNRKRNGQWTHQRIHEMLSNEKYTGNALLQKQYRNNHLEKKLIPNKGTLPQYYAEGTHNAIIDMEIFQKAQERLLEIKNNHTAKKPQVKSVFTGIITCPKCNKNYKRNTSNGSVGFNCRTYLEQGKSACHGKKIPEDTLISVCKEVLGIDVFNENLFTSKVKQIIVPKPNYLLFILTDGIEVKKVWQDRSRRDSWTDEMKQSARERTNKGLTKEVF